MTFDISLYVLISLSVELVIHAKYNADDAIVDGFFPDKILLTFLVIAFIYFFNSFDNLNLLAQSYANNADVLNFFLFDFVIFSNDILLLDFNRCISLCILRTDTRSTLNCSHNSFNGRSQRHCFAPI